jgi:hypothetical protein
VTKIKTFLMHASISRMSWLAILAAWLLARGGMMFLVHPMIVGDQTAYIQFARDFLASNGTVLSGRSPAYVVFLSGSLWYGPRVVYALQSLMTLTAALLTRQRLGFWQGFVVAVCPFFVIWEWSLLTETLCVTALWCAWLLIFWQRRRADLAIGGFLIGFAVLTRPVLMLLPVAAVALLSGSSRRPPFVVLATAYLPVIAAFCIVSGPSTLGMNLWIGSWEQSPGWMMSDSITNWPPEAHLTTEQRRKLLNAYATEDDRAFLDAALERYRTEPLKAVASWFARYPYLWIGTRTAFSTLPKYSLGWWEYKLPFGLLNLGILMFGLAGGLEAFRRGARETSLLVPIAYVAVVYLPFHNTETRYTIIAIPFLLVLSVYWFGARQSHERSLRHRRTNVCNGSKADIRAPGHKTLGPREAYLRTRCDARD